MTLEFKYVGHDTLRPDAISKATGTARFLDDIFMPGMLFATILRPDYAHAKIISIDTNEAEACDGVVKVVTGAGCTIKYGDNIRDLTPMAVDKVRYIGEPVAAVIAESAHQAQQAVSRIKVEYEPLPVYTKAIDAIKPGTTLIHKSSGDYWHLPGLGPIDGTNVANYYKLRKGDCEKGFSESDFIVEEEFEYPFGSCSAIEPHGSIVWFHRDKTVEVWSSSICPFIIREEIARAYELSASNVRVHIPELGGCFGYKSDITVEQTIAYIASFVPGYPVKWIASRREDFLSTLLGHGINIKMKLGATKEGKFLALKSEIHHSTGAYSDTGVHVSIAAAHNSAGAYHIPNNHADSHLVYTNTPAIGAFRGYGHQEAQFGMERMVDIMARKIKTSPFELREKNYLGPGKITGLGELMCASHGNMQAVSDKVREVIYQDPFISEDDQYFYGRGFAAIMKTPKGAPFSSKSCYIKFNVDGSISINMAGAEVGQGLRTVVRQVAAEALKIPPERIRVYTEIDTQFSPWEWQTIGSMFTTQGGRAIIRAANKAINMLKQTASQVLRCDTDMLEYDGKQIFLRSDPSVQIDVVRLVRGYIYDDGMTVGEVVQATADARLPRYSGYDPDTGQGTMGVSHTFGAQGCTIRINKKSGKISVDHFASAFDVGKVINPKQIRGQIVGGVMMGIGATLHEELRFDKEGKAENPSFGKYRFPTIKDAPGKQTVICVETPGEIGPFGARGIGEHPVIGVAPAILNAIYDAIGHDFYRIPVTPKQIKAVLEDE